MGNDFKQPTTCAVVAIYYCYVDDDNCSFIGLEIWANGGFFPPGFSHYVPTPGIPGEYTRLDIWSVYECEFTGEPNTKDWL